MPVLRRQDCKVLLADDSHDDQDLAPCRRGLNARDEDARHEGAGADAHHQRPEGAVARRQALVRERGQQRLERHRQAAVKEDKDHHEAQDRLAVHVAQPADKVREEALAC